MTDFAWLSLCMRNLVTLSILAGSLAKTETATLRLFTQKGLQNFEEAEGIKNY